MRQYSRIYVVAASTVLLVGLLSASARAGIVGSAHDFSSYSWSGNQICAPCHTPHGATLTDTAGNLLGGPLWNHTLSTQGITYTMYNTANYTGQPNPDTNNVGGTFVNNTSSTGTVDTNSELCLSCHDGTVALDSFGGASGTTTWSNAGLTDSSGNPINVTPGAPGSVNLGTDLSKDHPIGSAAVYTNVSYMNQPSTWTASAKPTLRILGATNQLVVGCTSCHEPHNRYAPNEHLLIISNIGTHTTATGASVPGSALCLSCHKK